MRLIDADKLSEKGWTHLIKFYDGKVIDSKKLSDIPTLDYDKTNYCPNCGVKMDGGGNDGKAD